MFNGKKPSKWRDDPPFNGRDHPDLPSELRVCELENPPF
jgi:hypothetical protein